MPENSLKLCGPDELAQTVINARVSGASSSRSVISSEGIRRLIKTAYLTSCAAEEGRYPQFRLLVADGSAKTNRWFDAMMFDKPQVLDVESLRRLAPIAADSRTALVVKVEADGTNLYCTGLKIFGGERLGVKTGDPAPPAHHIAPPSFLVRVEGPGRLRVTEYGRETWLLDRGEIHPVKETWDVEDVKQLWKNLAKRLLERLETSDELTEELRGSMTLDWHLHRIWSCVLSTAVEKRHGGTFVIVPRSNKNKALTLISSKNEVKMSFGETIRKLWQSCVDYRELEKNDLKTAEAEGIWNTCYETVLSEACILAGLSSVDGCVVLDDDLNVQAFGAKIKNTILQDESKTEGVGTRHQSAYGLATSCSGVIVFVISQDGDLKVLTQERCKDDTWRERFDAWAHGHGSQ